MVKDLEEELDVKLLIRTTRKIELTDAGKLLFQYGQQIHQTLKQFYQELDDTKNSKKGYVKIGIFLMLGTKLLSKMIAEFHKLYPEIRVRFVEDGAANRLKMLFFHCFSRRTAFFHLLFSLHFIKSPCFKGFFKFKKK